MTLSYRSLALWMLGYPEAALADAEHALKDAREIGQAATLMHALYRRQFCRIFCGNYAAANALSDELVALADQKASPYWKAVGMLRQGCVIGPDRQSRGRRPNDHLRAHRISANRSDTWITRSFCHTWRALMQNSANSMMLGAALAKR